METTSEKPIFAEYESFSVRDKYEIDDDNYYKVGESNTKYPHHYLSLNSLGKTSLTPSEIMGRMQSDWSKVFPMGATGMKGSNKVFYGQVFKLPGPPMRVQFGPESLAVPLVGTVHFTGPLLDQDHLWNNYVGVTGVTSTTVTVTTKSQHVFVGNVENGVFRDSSGETWLYQDGTGENDGTVRRFLNYKSAKYIWILTARNVRNLMDEPAPAK